MSAESEKFLQQIGKKEGNPYEAEDRELETALGHIHDIAKRFKLDPYPTTYDVVPAHIMYEVGSYGLPRRASHWTHGRDYWRMKTSYDYGMSKIYEVVINSDPAQGFLLENNPPIENKVVMAHVTGHSDMFNNNFLLKDINRDMPNIAALSAERIDRYGSNYGEERVEKVLDALFAIEQNIDPLRAERPYHDEEMRLWHEEIRMSQMPTERKGKFDDLSPTRVAQKDSGTIFDLSTITLPPTPDKDLLGIIRNHAPFLEEWERDVIDIVRQESVYFYPQRRTKIMNEGWATYWHKRIMQEMGGRELITPSEKEHFDIMHSNIAVPIEEGIQPYYFGLKMFEYLEDYYNGNLTDAENAWLIKEGQPVYPKFVGNLEDSPALPKLREAMMYNDDQSFVRNYFNKITADRMNYFVYEDQQQGNEIVTVIKDKGWIEVRDEIVDGMTNNGMPTLLVSDIDHEKKQELYIKHLHEGKDLETEYVEKTLPYIHHLWRRPVHLETYTEGTGKTVFTFDGQKMQKVEERKPPTPNPFMKPSYMQRNWP